MVQRIAGYCTLCRSRCGAAAVLDAGRLTGLEPLPGHPTGGALCAKGRATPELLYSPRRLTRPLRRTAPRGAADPGWREIGWDEALDEIGARLASIRAESGAESVAFSVTTPSGTSMVDSFEWVERFVRCFGSPNLIYAVEVCGWHKDYAHMLTFGRGIGVPDYDKADVVVLWGHNPARTWLAQATRIADARRRGARVVVVDPRPNGSGQDADLFLRIRPGADTALALGAIRHLIATRSYDVDFVSRWTNGPLLVDPRDGRLLRAAALWPDLPPELFVALDRDGTPRPFDASRPPADAGTILLDGSADLRIGSHTVTARTAFALLSAEVDPYTVERVAELTWIGPSEIAAFNTMLMDGPRLAYHSWTGVGQHTNATATERAIAVLYALTGACDRPGGNLWTVPPTTLAVNDYGILPPGQQAKALGLDALPLGPPGRGWITARDFCEAAIDGKPYRVRALMSFGTNFVVSQGNSSRNQQALRSLDFHVHTDLFLNPTAENADIVLPANAAWEHAALKIGFEVTQEAAETIQFRPQAVPPPGESRADYEIVMELARRLGMADRFFDGNIEAGWNHQLSPLGLTVEDLRAHPGGLRVPQRFGHEKYAVVGQDGRVAGFATPSRLVELYSERLRDHGYPPLPMYEEPASGPFAADHDPAFPLILTTAKSGWFTHSSLRHVSSLRRKSPDPLVEIAPALAVRRGLEDGDWAVVSTPVGSARLRVRLNGALDERVVIAEFGWWEDCPPLGRGGGRPTGEGTWNINDALSDAKRDPVSGSVPLRAASCEIWRDDEASRGHWTGKRPFRIIGRHRESSDVVALELVPDDGGPLPDFLPGQHVTVGLPELGLSRAYSLTGPARRPVSFTIAVKRERPTTAQPIRMSEHMHALSVGSRVELGAPSGVFTPPLTGPRPLLFLAAGIGITPFLGYLETLALLPAAERVSRVLLMHGCRNGAEHPFAARLRQLETELPELARVTAYSAPGPGDRLATDYRHAGRIDPAAASDLLARRPLAYLCGSPDFVESMTDRLLGLGLPRFDIFAEAFASVPAVPATLAPQLVHIAGTDQRFLWTPGSGVLLDAAQANGVALPSGCRVGQCESCAVRVVRGSVARLDGEQADGDRCLTCQTVPLSELTLAL